MRRNGLPLVTGGGAAAAAITFFTALCKVSLHDFKELRRHTHCWLADEFL